MRRVLATLFFCGSFSVIFVIGLSVLSGALVRKPGNFLRILPPHPAIQRNDMDVKYDSYYIAGVANGSVYLGNYLAPLHLLVVNESLTDSQHVKISIPNVDKEKFWSVKVKVDSPFFFLADGARPIVYKGLVSSWQGSRVPFDSAYFIDYEPIGSSSFAIRSLSSKSNEYELGKEIAGTSDVWLDTSILEKQIDGKFCVDGMMDYDRKSSRLVYTYYYRNQFIVMDSSLKVTYRGHTIDTSRYAKISIATLESDGSQTMSAPPRFVNLKARVNGKWLFVNSNLMARNESRAEFDKVSVIDVYDLKEGEYRFSFYLSHYTHARVSDFDVYGGKLYALFDRFIVAFDLQERFFY